MNIFYNKKTLLDSLIGVSNYRVDTIQKTIETTTVFFDKDTQQLVGFNILNVSKEIELNDGRQILTDQLKNYIQQKCQCQLNTTTQDFIVGKIVACEKIEDTHLSKCVIDIGTPQQLKIVCGGINARIDLIVVVAMIGTIMPSGMLIEESMLRGNLSQGMLCSASELNLKGFGPDKGIIELDQSYLIGSIFLPAYAK